MRPTILSAFCAVGLLLASVATPAVSHAQLARLGAPPPPPPSAAADDSSPAPWKSATTARSQGSSTASAEIPLAEQNRIWMMRTMAGVGQQTPQFVKCDTSQLDIGGNGGTVVMGDTYFINDGKSPCPAVGKQLNPLFNFGGNP